MLVPKSRFLDQYIPHSESLEEVLIHKGFILSRSNNEVHLTNDKSLEPIFKKVFKRSIRNAGFVKIKKKQSNLWIAGENHTAVWRKKDWLWNGKPNNIKSNLTYIFKTGPVSQFFLNTAPRISKYFGACLWPMLPVRQEAALGRPAAP